MASFCFMFASYCGFKVHVLTGAIKILTLKSDVAFTF